MAILDKTFYQGTDQYSDGDEAENTILQIVREGKCFNDLEQMTWPVFYHLNPVRENICNWYPFERGSRVLEIGAGCGAVTGALCNKGLKVYSVDLSLRRSTINYERHRETEDLHLIVGNLNDISFEEPFDYILLIGVLEYAGRFTEGDHPYQLFLENVRRWLKPNGKLLIAIENRIGLKYFAGAAEDHLGTPFIGLRGYPEDRGIRTFSRRELEYLLRKSGYQDCQFYYPYPDYKLPQEILTDDIFVAKPFAKPYQVFDLDRTDIFPETEMLQTLRKEGIAGAFSNSFLVEVFVAPAKSKLQQIYYTKINRNRKKDFQTGIKIYGDGKPEFVSRYALTKAAEAHIARIAENENRLSKERSVLKGLLKDSEIIYTHASFRTLGDELLEAGMDRNREAILHIFQQIRMVLEVRPVQMSFDSEGFTQWFGETKATERMLVCSMIGNVGLTPDSIVVNEEGELITADCEWVTDFAVPVQFLIWYSVIKTYEGFTFLQKLYTMEDLLRALDIMDENIPVYQEWSQHFEYIYISEKNVSDSAKSHELTDFYPAAGKMKDLEMANEKAQINLLIQHERELTEETTRQKAYIEELIRNNIESEENARQEKERAQNMERDLKDILSSRSWRMTEAFRTIYGKVTSLNKKKKS